MSVRKLRRLFEPIKINETTLKNRIVMPSMSTNFPSKDGYVTDRLKDYFEERAKGGTGLIIVEGACIDFPRGKYTSNMLSIDDDKYLPGLKNLVGAIHKHNAKASIQIHHAGPRALWHITGIQPVGPSPISTMNKGYAIPRELSIEEIKDIILRYGQAIERAKSVGFDAVEIQFGGGYLLGSFLSAILNRRSDEYGGSLENRSKIHREIIQEARRRVGNSFPICCRFNVKEWGGELGIKGCRTVEEGKLLAKMFESEGVSAISVLDYGFFPRRDGSFLQDHFRLFPDERGIYVPLSEAIKQVVSVPVITAGRITPRLAEKILKAGKADLIAVGRQTIVDPYWPQKAAEGRVNEIAPCIVCRNCVEKVFVDEPIECSVNTAAGREREYKLNLAQKRKNVVIVGGGPAGLEAGRVSALRGHKVSIYDKDWSFGGLLPVAAVVKGLEPENFFALAQYFRTQMKILGIKVVQHKVMDKEFIRKIKPDVLVLACGGSSDSPKIPGIEGKNVVDPESLRGMLKFFLAFFSPKLLRFLNQAMDAHWEKSCHSGRINYRFGTG